MNKNIHTIALLFATVLFFQESIAFAAVSPDEVVELVNRERIESGLPVLARSGALDRVALAKVLDMDEEKYFAHTSPSGKTPWHWFQQEKYDYRYAGENLAIHFKNASAEHRAWMESVKHCENILSPKYSEIGVAVRNVEWEGKTTTITVQSFGTRMGDEGGLALKNTRSVCPKVLSSGIVSDRNNTPSSDRGFIGSILSSITKQFNIETGRLLALFFFGLAQAVGVVLVMMIVYQTRWSGRW